MLPLILGLSGPALSDDERAFLRDSEPAGLILFGRNVVNPAQLRALTDDLRSVTGRGDLPVLIDQEGGRVARLGPPHWPDYPPGVAYGRIYERDEAAGLAAARLGTRLMAADLCDLGISVDCVPVADVP